jgi:hypothetical protein
MLDLHQTSGVNMTNEAKIINAVHLESWRSNQTEASFVSVDDQQKFSSAKRWG